MVFPAVSFSSRPEVAWIHAGAEILMATAFYFLTTAWVYFLYSRKDLKFRWGFLPALFLFSAGTIHVVHLMAPFYPIYALEALLKFVTVFFAMAAVVLIRQWVPKALDIPHPSQMKETLRKINEEIAAYKQNEKSLIQNREKLERDLKQSENEMELLPSLAEGLLEASDFDAALEMTIRKVCERMGWDYGEAWMVAESGKVLEYTPAWHGDARFEALRRISQELKFPPDMDLSGRVWASKKPEVIRDVFATAGGTFLRVPMCRQLGVKAAFGVPVFIENRIVAILIFLMREFREQDSRRVTLVTAAVRQLLGAIIEKKAAEKMLREAQEQQEKRIRERTKDLLKTIETLEVGITEHELTEENLRRSQENFSTLLNSIDGIVWEFDLRNSKFSFVSEQAERMLGYPAKVWSTEPTFWQDHIHGVDRAHAVSFRARVAQEKKDDRFEYRMITADGRTIWLRDMVTVVVEKNQAVKLRGVMVNITEPKQVEEALNQERNFVSAVFETASALVMVLDTGGRIVRFNRACEQISGYSAEEARGKFFWDLFLVPEEIARAKSIFNRLLAGQYPINDESYWLAKDGSRPAIAWSNTVLLNTFGAVIHVIATGVDITKRKEVEQKLKETVMDLARSNRELDKSSHELKDVNQRLRELDEIKSHFISAASHELRTPLTSIKGYVESILEDEVGPLNEKQKEFLGYVKSSTDRLHRLLNELLDISKIESGQVKMVKDLTNMKDLLKEEMMIFKAQAGNKNITLTLETDPHLREIYCDADKIREVMDNLMSNAVKYTAKNGRVKIEAKNYESGVQIDVQDSGIGIKKEDLARIFEPFQHIEKNGTEDEESTGLGLTLARRIVEAHEGNVRVKSEEGKGSTFTVVLPLGSRSEESKNLPWVVTQHE